MSILCPIIPLSLRSILCSIIPPSSRSILCSIILLKSSASRSSSDGSSDKLPTVISFADNMLINVRSSLVNSIKYLGSAICKVDELITDTSFGCEDDLLYLNVFLVMTYSFIGLIAS